MSTLKIGAYEISVRQDMSSSPAWIRLTIGCDVTTLTPEDFKIFVAWLSAENQAVPINAQLEQYKLALRRTESLLAATQEEWELDQIKLAEAEETISNYEDTDTHGAS